MCVCARVVLCYLICVRCVLCFHARPDPQQNAMLARTVNRYVGAMSWCAELYDFIVELLILEILPSL